jgi:hypothetical protein
MLLLSLLFLYMAVRLLTLLLLILLDIALKTSALYICSLSKSRRIADSKFPINTVDLKILGFFSRVKRVYSILLRLYKKSASW